LSAGRAGAGVNLFQSEVPEIYDNTVVIRAIAREAGERTKLQFSPATRTWTVGACVGMKGMRVQSIIRELRGEKSTSLNFRNEITTFAEKALQPAKVSRVSVRDLDRQGSSKCAWTIRTVAGYRAIKGQNVRLPPAAGWDSRHQERMRENAASCSREQMQALTDGSTTPIEAW